MDIADYAKNELKECDKILNDGQDGIWKIRNQTNEVVLKYQVNINSGR